MIAPLLLALGLAAPLPPRAAPPPGAAPPAEADLEVRLEAALGAIHGAPGADGWRGLGPGAVPALARLARDEAALPSRRSRAVAGLSFLGGPEADAAVRALAARDALPPGVRAAALRGAGRLLPAGELAGLLLPVLRAAGRPADRAMAAAVLAERAPAACPEVRARAAAEAAADLPAWRPALDRCAARPR